MKPEQWRLCDVLKTTLIQLCSNGLHCVNHFRVQGTVVITVDDTDFSVMQLDETVSSKLSKEASSHHQPSVNVSQDQMLGRTPDSESRLCKSPPDITPSLSRKRARHRLEFSKLNSMNGSDDTKPDLVNVYRAPSERCSILESDSLTSLPDLSFDINGIAAGEQVEPVSKKLSCCPGSPADESTLIVVDSEEENTEIKENGKAELDDGGIFNLRILNVVGSHPARPTDRALRSSGIKNEAETIGSTKREMEDCINMDSFDEDDVVVNAVGPEPDRQDCALKSLPSNNRHSFPDVMICERTQMQKQGLIPASSPMRVKSRVQPPLLNGEKSEQSPARCVNPSGGATGMTTPKSVHNIADSSPRSSGRQARNSPLAFKTMFVCNVGRCNRGFAYKKNLLRHQMEHR